MKPKLLIKRENDRFDKSHENGNYLLVKDDKVFNLGKGVVVIPIKAKVVEMTCPISGKLVGTRFTLLVNRVLATYTNFNRYATRELLRIKVGEPCIFSTVFIRTERHNWHAIKVTPCKIVKEEEGILLKYNT